MLFVASVASVFARVCRESWDESSFNAITRLETHATQTNSFVNQSFSWYKLSWRKNIELRGAGRLLDLNVVPSHLFLWHNCHNSKTNVWETCYFSNNPLSLIWMIFVKSQMISLVSRTETLPLWPRFESYLNTFLLFGHLSNSSPLVLLSHLFRIWQRCSGTLAPVLRTRRYATSVEPLDQFQFLSILLVRFLLTFSHP